MKRKIFYLLLLTSYLLTLGSSLSPARAQEKYNVVLEQAKSLTPYEALYLLMDYQYWHPEFSNIYYQLGNVTYDLLPTRDPLHHYSELSTLLYQSRLFYGNCLHFAKDQKLQGWQFAEIADGQKRIEYTTLEQYISPRLDEIQRRKTACDSIHNTFVRMTERYNRCQALFTGFLTRYTRVKTAHLQLQPAERQMLVTLRQAADSLDADIQAYLQALTLQSIEGYEPVFRKEPIQLYRLDGLSYTDFLQNDIATWDYSKWVTDFLEEQQTVYEQLYSDLEREQTQLEAQLMRYEVGRPISGQVDAALISRCERLELATPQVDSVRAMQERVLNASAWQTMSKTPIPKTISELLPLLQIAAARRKAQPDNATQLINEHLIQTAQLVRSQQQATYTHPVTGDVISYEPMPGETVYCLLPDDAGFRCAVTDASGAACVLYLNRNMGIIGKPIRQPGEQPLVFTRIPGRLWVFITDKNVYWLE